jgi:3-deoxy-D-manno-octulosonic-acid transferase
MFDAFELCLMQSDLDTERLLQIGIGPEKVRTVGNIKFDREWPSPDEMTYKKWLGNPAFEAEELIWVAGSTHQGEEEVLLDVLKGLRPLFPTLCLVIAPRRIERADEVHSLSRAKGFAAVLRSQIMTADDPYDVLVLDTLGELSQIYGAAKVSFVGGSLVPVGGHNLLEPAVFGRPVLFGPHTHNFVHMSRMLEQAGGGRQVMDGEELLEVMKGLLSDPGKAERMGDRAKSFVTMNSGALRRVMSYLEEYL